MIQIISFILLSVTTISINAQTKTITDNCPTGQYVGFQSSDYQSKLFPVTVLAGVTYNTNGIYQTAATYTPAQSADQCCKNCATQSNGVCTAWTYDGCNTCYLSSVTGPSNYLFSSGNKNGCSSFVSGIIPKTTTPGSIIGSSQPQTTTTVAYSCFSSSQIRSVSGSDIKVSATTLSDCCNACGNYAGSPKCFGFEFRTADNSCWLKTYNPFADSNQKAGDGTIYTGIVTGVL